MSSASAPVASENTGETLPPDDADALQREIKHNESRNLWALAAYSVMLRVGWVFKTESVIMPAFLDLIAGPGWVRGFLPVLSRFGQSVPPVMFAESLRRARLKKRSLIITSTLMSVPFVLLSIILFLLDDIRQPWLPPLFLVMYAVFFSLTGLNQLAFGTIQGKLITTTRRGWLMGVSGVVGSICAVTAALVMLGRWLDLPAGSGYRYIFLFNGAAFFVAGLIVCACRERPEPLREYEPTPLREHFARAWRVYRGDVQFRRAARVGMLFLTTLLLFPHYQWLGQEVLHAPVSDLMVWVVVQNISVGVLSLLFGMVADRFGNRLAVRLGVFGAAVIPLFAMYVSSPLVADGRRWYWMTFVLLGFCPVTIRTIANYTLELTEPEHHSRYLSTMTVCYAVPFLASPFIGGLIDILPYQIPFVTVSALVTLGGLLTFRMSEPRHDQANRGR